MSDAAYCYRCSVVCLCAVCLCVSVSHTKAAEPFGLCTWVGGPRNHALGGGSGSLQQKKQVSQPLGVIFSDYLRGVSFF